MLLRISKISLESGCSGKVYISVDFSTDKRIVTKYGTLGAFEVVSVQKTGLYIAHTQKTLIMKHVDGLSYEDMLKNKSISDETKITFHKKVQSALMKLNQLGIKHGDPHPRHAYIKDDKITFIDFGNSEPVFDALYNDSFHVKRDLSDLNYHSRWIGQEYCGEKYNEYMRSQFQISFKEVYLYIFIGILLVITWNKYLIHHVKKAFMSLEQKTE